jgi:rRNA processing protein Krr1/Pno1
MNGHSQPVAAPAPAAVAEDGWEIQPSRRKRRNDNHAATNGAANGNDSAVKKPADKLQLAISAKFHRIIIGKAGSTLHLIQEATGTNIDIPKQDEGSEIVTITGETEGIARAKRTIESLIKTGYSPITHPGMSKNDIAVEERFHSRLVGSKGTTMRALQDATGTSIKLPSKGTKVSIVGESKGIALAKQYIQQLVADGFCAATHPGWTKMEIPFPEDRFGILIGPNGSNIRHICNSTGSQLNIPKSGSANMNLTLSGTLESIAAAKKLIDRTLADSLAADVAQEQEDEAWNVDPSMVDEW